MKAVLCLLLGFTGANSAIITCLDWLGEGLCSPGKGVLASDDRCVAAQSDLPPGEDVALCKDLCCRYPSCYQSVSCLPPSRVVLKRRCSHVNEQNSDGVRYCSEQTCCDMMCGDAVTCPAKMDSTTHTALYCSANPDSPRQCDVATCCVTTCGSSYTCPANYDSTTAAGVACTSASDGNSSDTLAVAACTTDLCCRTSCRSNAHECPAGSGYGKLEFRGCRKAGAGGAGDAMGSESQLPVCSDTVCCEVISKCPADNVCPANTKQKADVTKVDCFGTCTAADCCVDVSVTCAAAASKCTGNSTLKATPDKIACGLSAIAPAADACTLDKCCNVVKDAACADNTACQADGDSAAICQNGVCLCTMLYKRAKNSCAFNRVFFAVTFADGGEFTSAQSRAIDEALSKLGRLVGYRLGSRPCFIGGEFRVLFGSVSGTEIVEAIKTAVPASVLGTKVQVKLSKSRISNECKPADPGALAGVIWPLASSDECVPKYCDVTKGYAFLPVAHKCVLPNADGLTTAQIVGIVFGVIGFVALVVGGGCAVRRGRCSRPAPAEVEAAPGAQMTELCPADLQTDLLCD